MKKVFKRRRGAKYRTKILMAILAASLIPLVCCISFLYRTTERVVIDNLMSSRESQLQQLAQGLESSMQVYEHITDYMMSLPDLQEVLLLDRDQIFELYEGYRNTVDPLLQTNMYYHPIIRQITIYTMNIQLEHGNTVAPYYTLQNMEWYQTAFGDGVPEEKWVMVTDPKMVCYVRPVRQYGHDVAVLVTQFSYEGFLEGLSVVPTDEGQQIFVLNGDGHIVYADRQDVLGTNFKKYDASGYMILEEDMDRCGWKLVYAIPESMIGKAFQAMMHRSYLLCLFCIAFAIGASVVFSRKLMRRTVRLTNIVSRIGEESEAALAELEGYDGPEDEIGVLSKSIARMVRRLDELKAAVYKEKIARRDLEMKALQAQINPHFLYNSLSIINWKAIDADNDEVSQITLKLAEFYRTTLNRGSSMIDVNGEIRNIRSYLDIQLIMHDNNFTVDWELDDSVLNWKMPKLVLQPLVENALEHGLDLKEEDNRRLSLSVQGRGGGLELIVRDNGVGMTQDKADSLVYYDSAGYGVKNVKERIGLLYGEKHIFRITSKPGEGTEVYIKIPGEGGKLLCEEKN